MARSIRLDVISLSSVSIFTYNKREAAMNRFVLKAPYRFSPVVYPFYLQKQTKQ